MLEKIIKMTAAELGVDESTITADTSFQEDLGADSLDLVELVMALEDEYSVEIPTEELENLLTVNDVVKYLEQNQ